METRPRSSPGPRYPGFNSAILACTTSRRWLHGFSLMKLAAQRRVTPQARSKRGVHHSGGHHWKSIGNPGRFGRSCWKFTHPKWGKHLRKISSCNCEICWRYCRDIFSDDLGVGCLLPEKARILIHNDSLPSNILGSPK